jgi:hypothetical protein
VRSCWPPPINPTLTIFAPALGGEEAGGDQVEEDPVPEAVAQAGRRVVRKRVAVNRRAVMVPPVQEYG